MLNIYKPNPKVTGTGLSLQASDRDGKLYLNLIKQSGWNDQTKKGSFIANKDKPGASAVLKFNQMEAGALIDAIENMTTASFYHVSPSKSTRILFAPSNIQKEKAPNCFVLTINQAETEDSSKKTNFLIPFTFAEARVIKEYLIHYLHKSFSIKPQKTDNKQNQQPEEVVASSEVQPEAQELQSEQQSASNVDDSW
jgi:hypothetical protein